MAMNKSDKFLKKCTSKERVQLIEILTHISNRNLSGLDIKKLKGYDNYFRVRKGSIRIIFHLDINGSPIIQTIERKNDTTYDF